MDQPGVGTDRETATWYIGFSLNPVTAFIEASRTVRDLWTASYLLSWLTARAVAEGLKCGAKPVDKYLAESPLVAFHKSSAKTKAPEALVSAIPNMFLSRFEGTEQAARALAERMRAAVGTEWSVIADAVRKELAKSLATKYPGWNENWERQLRSYWDARVYVFPGSSVLEEKMKALGIATPYEVERLAIDFFARLAAADELIQHVRPRSPVSDTRPKCALSGTEEQMGPIDLNFAKRREFWEFAADKCVINGERLRARDTLGATALVKRFAWAASLHVRLGQESRALRQWDTATTAAAGWLLAARCNDPAIPDAHHYLHEWSRKIYNDWSGQWLHWQDRIPKRPEMGEKPPDEKVWVAIGNARKALGRPPTYYAVVAMDGDRMGGILGAMSMEDRRKASAAIDKFARVTVPELIRKYLGGDEGIDLNQPVYAGGDDVLMLLPMRMGVKGTPGFNTVLDAVQKVAEAFSQIPELQGATAPTMSAGVALTHFRSDLREALAAARSAEYAAKNAGRNCLALSTMRRSGEHTTALCQWEWIKELESIAALFWEGSASDRWTYQLRREIDTLAGTDSDSSTSGDVAAIIDIEMARLLSRSEERDNKHVRAFWDLCIGDAKEAKYRLLRGEEPLPPTERRRQAVTLIQSMSFIARGGGEKE